MKKTYIRPTLLQVKLATHQLIAESPLGKFDDGGGEVLVKENVFDFDSSSDDSYNVWDDWDDWDD